MSTNVRTDFTIESVLFSTDKIKTPVELKQITTDIDIFEDLNKPYLTANIIIVDDANFIETANIMGGEKITIAIASKRKNTKLIVKTFHINKITNQR